MKLVNILEAESQLSDLLALVEAGEEVFIPHHGEPVARVTPATRTGHKRPSGTWKNTLHIADDFNDKLTLGRAGPVASRSELE